MPKWNNKSTFPFLKSFWVFSTGSESQKPFLTQGREPHPLLEALCLHTSGDGKLTILQGFQTRLPWVWPQNLGVDFRSQGGKLTEVGGAVVFLNSLLELFTYLTVYSFKAYNSFALVYSQSHVSINTLVLGYFQPPQRKLCPQQMSYLTFPGPGNHEPTCCA